MIRISAMLAVLLALMIDQGTKAWALSVLWPPYSEGIIVLPVLNLRLGFNTGITFGILAESAAGTVWLLVTAKLVVVAFLVRWLWRTNSSLEALALGLVIGGAVGNIADRLRLGAVVDFIDAHYAGWHWPSFNMADAAIVSGVSLILVVSLRHAPANAPRNARSQDQ